MEIGLLFENGTPDAGASNEWEHCQREPEEIAALAGALQSLGHTTVNVTSIEALLERHRFNKLPNLIWNLFLGARSRNRTALTPALLEILGIPYIGGDAYSQLASLNKQLLKDQLKRLGIRSPDWRIYHDGVGADLPPWSRYVLKPACEGFSAGLRIGNSSSRVEVFRKQVTGLISEFRAPVICEELVVGREVSIAIIDGSEAFGALEVLGAGGGPIGDGLVNYAAKREGRVSRSHLRPEDSLLQKAVEAARRVAAELGPFDYATFDYRADMEGNLYLLDVNGDARLSPNRTFAKAFEFRGVSFKECIRLILSTALSRWGLQESRAVSAVNA